MRALLMHRDQDWDQEPALTERFRLFRPGPMPSVTRLEQALIQDLALETLLAAMAGNDEFLLDAARRALLTGAGNDAETILYRQEALRDCLENPSVVRELYAVVGETIEGRRKYLIGGFAHPGLILYSGIEALEWFVRMLRKLRDIADAHARGFRSKGFTALFGMLQQEFSDDYFASIQDHLSRLRFRQGVLISASLGKGNEGTNYTLHQPHQDGRPWFERLLGKAPSGYTFTIHERDEAGARALEALRDRGINLVADALAQSTEHILSFFHLLRAELAFYVACLNLRDTLAPLGAPICFPQPVARGERLLSCSGLYDVCLALQMGRSVVGNTIDARGKGLVIITGANQGGKSTFLRSVGLAQLMMQCGLFVPAESFTAELCAGVFTHYRREEDSTMESGKFDEELARMSAIADRITPDSLVLFNESFSSTNEREGSEIARQIVHALLDRRVKVFFVTHQYDFARSFCDRHVQDALFLRAERLPDGTRTFQLAEGRPLETSYGEDLYREVFGAGVAEPAPDDAGEQVTTDMHRCAPIREAPHPGSSASIRGSRQGEQR